MTNFEMVMGAITESRFIDIFNRFKQYIVLSILDSDVSYSDYKTKQDIKRLFSDFPKEVLDDLCKVIGDRGLFKIILVDNDLPHYQLYIIVSQDDQIRINGDATKPCDGYSATIKCKLQEDESDDYLTQFLILSNVAKGYRDENKYHIINHEIVHLVIRYMIHTKEIPHLIGYLIDNNMNEFLADFLPFYARQNGRYVNDFVEYGKRWFKEDVLTAYIRYVEDLVPWEL
jgi:hypothetical protein